MGIRFNSNSVRNPSGTVDYGFTSPPKKVNKGMGIREASVFAITSCNIPLTLTFNLISLYSFTASPTEGSLKSKLSSLSETIEMSGFLIAVISQPLAIS